MNDGSKIGKSTGDDELGFKDEHEVASLYTALLNCWNRRNAAEFAALFAPEGHLVGFDGSQVNGKKEIAAHLSQVFAQHKPPKYIGIVREMRMLGAEIALLRAVAGMVPDGKSDLNPALNAVQTIIAAQHSDDWRIEMFHNTPAAFHGRPQVAEQLSAELRDILAHRSL